MNENIDKPTMKLPPLKRICMTIGQLPTSYVESMSYYEMLVWFVHYLRDEVIPVVNANGEAVEELQELYVELQDYVNNYFDNLDIQEEIDNKLDEMVEAGTLQEIIADYLNSKAIFGFDTVEAMKESTNLIDGSYAETLGYYIKNDGGSALYKIRTITNNDIVDEMFIIALNDESLIAELIVKNNTVNIRQIGAKGNGVNDDYTYINNAISKYNVFIPSGNYLISSSITIPNYKSLIGENEKTTTIKGNNLTCVFLLSNSTLGTENENALNGILLKNITVDADNCDYGIYCNFVTNESELSNITIKNATVCNISIVKSWYSKFKNITAINGHGIGISIGVKQGTENDVYVNSICFENLLSRFNGSDDTYDETTNIEKGCGIIINNTIGSSFDQITCERNGGIGIIYKSYYRANFNSIYCEHNCESVNSRKIDIYNNSNMYIDNLYLASNGIVLLNSNMTIGNFSNENTIQTFYRKSGNTTANVKFLNNPMQASINSQSDLSVLKTKFNPFLTLTNVNLKNDLSNYFYVNEDLNYMFYIIMIPHETKTVNNNVSIKVNNVTRWFGTNDGGTIFTDGALMYRNYTIVKGINKIETVTKSESDIVVDIMIGNFVLDDNMIIETSNGMDNLINVN